MAGKDLAEQVAEVRRHREVAALEAARRVETGPAPERAPQPAARIVRVVLGPILRGVRLLQQLYGLEGFLRGRRQQAGRRAGVQLLEGAGEAVARRFSGRAQPERLQVVDRERRSRPRE